MASRLGVEYPIDIQVTSKPRADYRTDEWTQTELPCAPAIMIGDVVVVEGSDITDEKVVSEIKRQLGILDA